MIGHMNEGRVIFFTISLYTETVSYSDRFIR